MLQKTVGLIVISVSLLTCGSGTPAPSNASTVQSAFGNIADHVFKRRALPQAAIDACSSLAAAATCSFVEGTETINGTCKSHAEGDAGTLLACHPSPPAEMVAACASLTETAACTIVKGTVSIPGVCSKDHDDGDVLMCDPRHAEHGEGDRNDHRLFGRGEHGPSAEAVTACASLAADATCSFVHHTHSVQGTCKALASDAGTTLACRGPDLDNDGD